MPEPASDLSGFQADVGVWADSTFTHSTPLTILEHLDDERKELRQAVESARRFRHSGAPLDKPFLPDRERIAEEAADILLLLLHLAHKEGFDLLAAAREKHVRNQRRTWSKPDRRGVSRHVAEGGDDA